MEEDGQSMNEQQFEVADIRGRGPDDARLVKYGTPVWAIVSYLRVNGWNLDDIALGFEIPPGAVKAAINYYYKYKEYIDARILLNNWPPEEALEPAGSHQLEAG